MSASVVEPISVTVKVAAEITGLSVWSVYELVNKGEIVSSRPSRRILVDYQSLKQYVASHQGATS